MFKAMGKLTHNLLDIWKQELSPNFQLKWMDIWMKHNSMKEICFLWALLHQALAINAWKVNTNQNIMVDCPSCVQVFFETFVHKFWSCPRARKAWEMAFHNHVSVKTLLHMIYTHKFLSLEYYMFNKRLPNNLRTLVICDLYYKVLCVLMHLDREE
jgi:hypothetical protein